MRYVGIGRTRAGRLEGQRLSLELANASRERVLWIFGQRRANLVVTDRSRVRPVRTDRARETRRRGALAFDDVRPEKQPGSRLATRVRARMANLVRTRKKWYDPQSYENLVLPRFTSSMVAKGVADPRNRFDCSH